MYQVEQAADIGEVEAHGGFLQKKEMVSRTTSPSFHMGVIGGDLSGRKFSDKFEALGFAP